MTNNIFDKINNDILDMQRKNKQKPNNNFIIIIIIIIILLLIFFNYKRGGKNI